MHTFRRHENPLERLSDTLAGVLKRRLVDGMGLVLLGLCVALALALASWSVKDPSLNHATATPVHNLLGAPGAVAADLLIQIFGLGAAALLIAPLAWSLRLLRWRGVGRLGARVALWATGSWCASAAASALPTTTKWPLPTGLGGVAGDALLGAVRMIGALAGPLGSTLAGVGFAMVAVATLAAACGFGQGAPILPASADGGRAARSTADRDDAAGDDEPSRAVIWLGALAHGLMSAKANLKRRAVASEAPRLRAVAPAYLDPRGPRPTAASPAASIRREPVFDPTPASPARATSFEPFDRPESEMDADPRTPDATRSGLTPTREDDPLPELAAGPMDRENDSTEEDVIEVPPAARRISAPSPVRISTPSPARVAPTAAPVRAARTPSSRPSHPSHAQPGEPESYEFPPLHLLAEPKKQVATVSKDALEQNATLLESTLEDFGVRGEIINVRPGPVVTLYELEPAPGTKSSRVISLADDIARSMSAVSARVAVVPGRNVIGIELPNAKRETVYLRELLASQDFVDTKQKLALCLGKNIGGEPIIADLARMPHLLVAGTTGSGKSVAINTMILSLLYMHRPEQCRLIMVDPKMLELSVYDGIPHLLTPVVTDPKKAVIALKWAVREMEERYKKMSKLAVRNIDGFNARVAEAKEKHEVITRTVQTGFDRETGQAVYEDEIMDLEPLPYIVVIVDEMADLMMVAGKDIEGAIQRLAQMARAAGIHLIMATQRPSVDVITGTIKANFPTRISFQVTSKIDSRTILGEMGAEQLLGQGDMLYMMGGGRITRVHGPFVSDAEVEKVVDHLKSQGRPQYLDSVTSDEEAPSAGDDAPVFDKGAMSAAFGDESADPYDQAVAVVLRDKKASTSYIQRRLGIGYNRAASIMERMENEGIVGPANHAGKREILLEGAVAGDGD